jgi:hypothetical protein
MKLMSVYSRGAILSSGVLATAFFQFASSSARWRSAHSRIRRSADALRKSLTGPRIRSRVKKAELDGVWNAETIMAFPDKPELTSISFCDSVLRLVWQESSPGWIPVPEKNFQREEGPDLFEYRAWR